MINQNSTADWFYRLLEIRKFPQSVTQEEILKMADDLVYRFLGENALQQKIVNFGLNKVSEITINNIND
jgi:hypothetical protein